MTSSQTIHQVNGIKFTVWADYMKRGCFARNEETGEVRQISSSGYINRDLTVRKAIAIHFDMPTFRKNAVKAA